MSEIKEPSTVSIEDAKISNPERDAIIERWKNYLHQQSVIKVLDGEKIAGYDAGVKFAVRFPRSFMHMHDFEEGMMSAMAEARFFEGGHVEIEGIEYDTVWKNFDQAWSEIYRRCTGKDLEFLLTVKVPENAIAEDLEKKFSAVREKLVGWENAFKKIPVVYEVEIIEDNEYGDLMEIRLFANGSFMLNREDCEAIDDYRLRSSGYVSYAEYSSGESDTVYDTWCNELTANETLVEFYTAVLDLNSRYLSAVPDAPIE